MDNSPWNSTEHSLALLEQKLKCLMSNSSLLLKTDITIPAISLHFESILKCLYSEINSCMEIKQK